MHDGLSRLTFHLYPRLLHSINLLAIPLSAMSAHPLLPPMPSSSSSTGPAWSRYSILAPAEEAAGVFHPHSSLSAATTVGMQSAGVGLLVSAVQNALETWVAAGRAPVTAKG